MQKNFQSFVVRCLIFTGIASILLYSALTLAGPISKPASLCPPQLGTDSQVAKKNKEEPFIGEGVVYSRFLPRTAIQDIIEIAKLALHQPTSEVNRQLNDSRTLNWLRFAVVKSKNNWPSFFEESVLQKLQEAGVEIPEFRRK